MSVLCRDIADFMEGVAPGRLAEDWDNVGLLAGSMDREVSRILLCLDVTMEVVNEAAESKAELILSHHPVIFKGVKRLIEEDARGRLLNNIIKHDISVYSAHTNLDVAVHGVNDILARRLNLKDVVNYKDYGNPDDKGYQHGLGKVGFLEKRQRLDAFALMVKSALELENVRVTGDPAAIVNKVAVFCGSFDDDLEPLKKHGVDVLVTGDVKYHTALDALQMGKCVIDAGHFYTEKIVLPVLAEKLAKRFTGIEALCSRVERDPFSTY